MDEEVEGEVECYFEEGAEEGVDEEVVGECCEVGERPVEIR